MLRPCILAVLDDYEKKKKRAVKAGDTALWIRTHASILFDRSISSRAHSHVSCSSLMSTVGISSAQRKVLGGEWVCLGLLSFSTHCEGHFPLADCPINQHPVGRGSFLVPVTTSDCLRRNSSRTSRSQRLIIVLIWLNCRCRHRYAAEWNRYYIIALLIYLIALY